jgi:hypothetical protein
LKINFGAQIFLNTKILTEEGSGRYHQVVLYEGQILDFYRAALIYYKKIVQAQMLKKFRYP